MKRIVALPFSLSMSSALLLSLSCAAETPGSRSSSDPEGASVAVETAESAPVLDETPVYEFFEKIDSLLQEEKIEEAKQAFLNFSKEPGLAPFDAQLRQTRIHFFLYYGDDVLAKETFLSDLREVANISTIGADVIYSYYIETGNPDAALAWANILTAQNLPPALRATAREWVAIGLFRAGDKDGALAQLDSAFLEFSQEQIESLASKLGASSLSSPVDTAFARQLAALLLERAPESSSLNAVAATLRVRSDALDGDWDAVRKTLPELPAKLSLPQLQQTLRALFAAARQVSRPDSSENTILEALAEDVIFGAEWKNFANARHLASREWIDALFASDRPDTVATYAERLQRLIVSGVPTSAILSIYTSRFFDASKDLESLPAVIAQGKSLRALLADETDIGQLDTCDLDAAFLLGDYDSAIAILEKGLPERDEAWTQMAIGKVRAHQALAEGRFADAVALFEKFITDLPDEDQIDPSTGIVHSKKLITADNKLRIGDIWRDAGQSVNSEASYKEALEIYAELAESASDPETLKYIQERKSAVEALLEQTN